MRATIDAGARLVIPSEVRRQAGLRPGMALELRWRDGRIEIAPAPHSTHREARADELAQAGWTCIARR
ncbi:MAG: antitoxin [Chloroflexi bacterium]|nr:antitoxin [Chloroflexota bacterium]